MREASVWRFRGGTLSLDRPRVMGILNVTPDSFSDGGSLPTSSAALDRAAQLVADGADLLDIGGESTRPGAEPVGVDDELRRVLPVVEAVAARFPDVPLSVDTRKAEVARSALEAGAHIVNDVSGLTFDSSMASTVAAGGAGLVVMHMRGTPADMRERAHYHDVVDDVRAELTGRLRTALDAGIAQEALVADPGLGFAKTAPQSLTLLRHLDAFAELGVPLLVGPSRKSFIGAILGVPPAERVAGTIGACVVAYLLGARILRVHDVQPVVQALTVAHAVNGSLV